MKARIVLAGAVLAAASIAAYAMPQAAGTTGGLTVKGEVLEVQKVETYTYMRLKTKDGEVWAAVPPSSAKKGDMVTLTDAMEMRDFESRAMKRKFDRILLASFAGDKASVGDKASAADKPKAAVAANPHGNGAAAPVAPVGKLAKASGADGRTVEEVYAQPAQLKGKAVTVRGQVVKVSSGILGKNWIHLQDGSGSASKGTHDLVVTTSDTPKVGDVVLASGKVTTDVNLGSGYAYAVLVEDAKLRK